jgi:hypothetical protein
LPSLSLCDYTVRSRDFVLCLMLDVDMSEIVEELFRITLITTNKQIIITDYSSFLMDYAFWSLSHSELIWKYESYRQSCRSPWMRDQPCRKAATYTQDNTNTE